VVDTSGEVVAHGRVWRTGVPPSRPAASPAATLVLQPRIPRRSRPHRRAVPSTATGSARAAAVLAPLADADSSWHSGLGEGVGLPTPPVV